MKKILVFAMIGAVFLLLGCLKSAPIETNDASGKKFGYILGIFERDGKKYIDFDEVKWLSASESTCATPTETCQNENVVCPGSSLPNCNPNGFLIVNEKPESERLMVSDDASIQKIDLSESTEPKSVTFEALQNFSASESYFQIIPFDIEIRSGVVTNIVEKYIP